MSFKKDNDFSVQSDYKLSFFWEKLSFEGRFVFTTGEKTNRNMEVINEN